jgi:hypothetical protein
MNKNLFLKIVFTTVSFLVLFLLVYFLIHDGVFGFVIGAYFTLIMGSLLRKLYIYLFKEDNFTQYLYLFLIIPVIVFAFILNKNNKTEERENSMFQKNFAKDKINSMLDTCNYYEVKLYDDNLLFKIKQDNNEYLASKDIKTYSKFELLKYNPKYDYLVPSFIKCTRDSSELVYIFDEEGTLSVILKLKNTDSTRLDNLKFYLEQFQKE